MEKQIVIGHLIIPIFATSMFAKIEKDQSGNFQNGKLEKQKSKNKV